MPKRIHIMQVTFGMGIGGMERVIMDLCRHVDPSRFRFSICCISVRGPLADQMEREGVRVIYCENQKRLGKWLRGVELGRIFREADVDVLHTHHLPAFIDGTIGRLFSRIPVLINTDHCKNYPIEPHLRLLERAASWAADEVVAVSQHTQDELVRFQGIAPEKISVIYNGIDVRASGARSGVELREAIGVPASSVVIGTVARLEDQKGLDLLLDAVPYLRAVLPDVRVVIVGGGSREADLKRHAEAIGVADRVIFTGWRMDAAELIQAFDCFALPSNFEGMPVVLLEAMAMGRPIVGTAVGGVPEVVRDGYSGVLVRSREPAVFAEALLRVAAHRGTAERMGRNGRSLYEQQFTAKAMVRAYEALYDKHLGRKGIVA